MSTMTINVKSLEQDGEFTGMIQDDDGTTSVAVRYTDKDKFLQALEVAYGYVPKSELEEAAE